MQISVDYARNFTVLNMNRTLCALIAGVSDCERTPPAQWIAPPDATLRNGRPAWRLVARFAGLRADIAEAGGGAP